MFEFIVCILLALILNEVDNVRLAILAQTRWMGDEI